MSSPFASRDPQTYPVPFDPEQTITVRKLTHGEDEAAQAEHLKGIIAGHSTRGWSRDFQKVLDKAAGNDEAVKVVSDPLNGYDRLSVAKAGLLEWSYGEITDATWADLTDEALEFVALSVMRWTHPERFRTADENVEAQKNG
jgi:hypothetical protein